MFNCWIFMFVFLVLSTGIPLGLYLSGKINDSEFATGLSSCLILLYIIINFVCGLCYINQQTLFTTQYSEEQNILGLKDNYTQSQSGYIRGNILFVYGEIRTDEKLYYRILAGNNEEGYKITDVDMSNTKLFFISDKQTPKFETVINKRVYKQKENWFFGGLIKVNNISQEDDTIIGYKLYIPKDAVKVDLTVDMK